MTGGSVTTKGSGPERSAAFAVRGATVNLTGVDVRTEGNDARGLHAFNAGSTVNAKGSRVTQRRPGDQYLQDVLWISVPMRTARSVRSVPSRRPDGSS